MRTKFILNEAMAGGARILLVMLLTTVMAEAAPFAKLIQFEQPGGERIELWGEGDEFYAVFETLDGYTVTFDPATKAYYYAKLSDDGNNLLSTGLKVGEGNPATLGLIPHLRINPRAVNEQAEERRLEWEKEMNIPGRWKALKAARQAEDKVRRDGRWLFAPPSSSTTGTKIGLTLLIDFPDQAATIAQSNIAEFCNSDDYIGYGNNGSIKEYFYDNSNGLLTYSNVVTVYIRMERNKTYYDDTSKDAGVQGNLLIRDAIAIMKALPNYTAEILPTFNNLTVDSSSNVVACNVFYAGSVSSAWSYGLWPHSWVLYYYGPQELSSGGKKVYSYQITDIGSSLSIGTFCHENGHMLCDFPDIYDYTYQSKGGAGSFCLMGYGGYDKDPVQVNAYLKRAAGWTTITELTSLSSLSASLTSSAGAAFNHFYRFLKPGVSTEYFIIENRQKSGRDARIKASGIAIWHVDELGNRDNSSLVTNTTHANYELTLVQADNQWHFQNNVNDGDAYDLYHSGNSSSGYSNEFSDTSAPNAHWWDGTASGVNFRNFSTNGATMTFVVGGQLAPTNLQASAGTYTDKVRVTWNAAFSATNYSIYRSISSSVSSAALLASTTALYYDDVSVSAGIVYYYWIKAAGPMGTSDYSAVAYGSTKLSAPTGLAASQGTGTDSVQLSWNVSSGATGYIIYRNQTSNSNTASEIARSSSLSYDDSSASAGSYYYYWLSAYSIASTSALSSSASGYRNFAAPTSVTASEGTYSSGVRISWDGVSGAMSYRIWRSATASSSAAVNVAETAYTYYLDASASAGRIYYYWVQAIKWSFTGPFSAYASGWRRSMAAGNNARGDLDGDGLMDFAVYQESTGIWYARLSGSGYVTASYQLGGSGYRPVSCDYDGDGHADPAVYNSANGEWIALLSSHGNEPVYAVLGGAGFDPVIGDYDGDGYADPAVYQESTGLWQAMLSKYNYTPATTVYGGSGYKAVAADYDGDGLVDPAFYYESSGENLGFWYMMLSDSGYTSYYRTTSGAGYVPVPADYDGDGKADRAIYNPASGIWYYWSSASNYPLPVSFTLGGTGYTAVPGDYDGDGKADIAVYREAAGQWQVLLSSGNYSSVSGELGGPGYQPVGAMQ